MGLKKKRAQMIGVVSTLAVASLVSVGFAAWTVSNTQTDTGTSVISADYTVTDKSIGDLVAGTHETAISFSAPSPATTGWLTASGHTAEDLEAHFQWTFTVGTNFGDTAPIVKDAAFSGDGKTAYEAKADVAGNSPRKGLVAALPAFTKGASSAQPSDTTPYAKWWISMNGTNCTLDIYIRLGWGELFGSKNPFEYYNGTIGSNPATAITPSTAGFYKWGSESTTTALDAAKTNIGALSSLNSLNLAFTFTVAIS